MNKNATWVVVAGNAEAKIFRLVQFPKIEEHSVLEHPESRLHNRDLISSKPGRNYDKGGTTRHAYEPKTDPKQQEIEKFAKNLSDFLSTSRQNGEFSRLYIMANPSFLGLLRQHLDNQTQSVIVAEIAKDLIGQKKPDIEEQLSKL